MVLEVHSTIATLATAEVLMNSIMEMQYYCFNANVHYCISFYHRMDFRVQGPNLRILSIVQAIYPKHYPN